MFIEIISDSKEKTLKIGNFEATAFLIIDGSFEW